MGWAWRVCRVAGIGIYLHWTFLLLIGWIFFSYLAAGQGWFAAAMGVAFLGGLFVCVALHELGHALAAKAFGVPTRDITLLPIGGVARLSRIPENPRQEFLIAAAGPAVNVIIAIILLGALTVVGDASELWPGAVLTGRFMQNLLWSNVVLVLFNLLPAFPMDGGRMLRAGLAAMMDYAQATRIAAGVGQILAIVFAFLGLFVVANPLLVFVALFVYLGAAGEAQLVNVKRLLRGVPVREAMISDFRALAPGDSIHAAADALISSMQQDFPVIERGRYLGMVRLRDLAAGLNAPHDGQTVSDIMCRDCPTVSERDMLESVMTEMNEADCQSIAVLRGDQVVGLVDTENIGELMMIRDSLNQQRSADSAIELGPAYRIRRNSFNPLSSTQHDASSR